MATLCKAKDGHWFVRKGFPTREGETPNIATYQVGPRAEQVVDYLRPQDGDEISGELFYALLLDGGIYHPDTYSSVSVYDLPDRYQPDLCRAGWSEPKPLIRAFMLTPGLSLFVVVEFFDGIRNKVPSKMTAGDVVQGAAVFFLEAKRYEEQERLRHGASMD